MPREENREIEEERRARNAYDLIRIRLNRLEKNIDKPILIPQRKDDPKPKAPPEFVRNVVGSSAAAGSSEFHIFRNNKRREQERLDFIEKQALKEDLDKEFEERKMARREAEEQKTARKREKRQRQKDRKRAKRAKENKGKNESSSDSEEFVYDEGNKEKEEYLVKENQNT
ncbi:hypothetical protein Mgra_00004216 [Meloidogyne graminicola]|uniref:PRKR-interacting protein 1 n=1 Tax=Meloidogyne graminicola TaxID=189291 RepID=A0A8S9ZT45_9BILA|nr:hypothetical protein Mgra_00004216 [Meloidogyne graminicola]